jgi:lysophospholipase L1-like esterase
VKFLLITTLAILSLTPCLHAKQLPLKKNDRIVFLGDSITAAGPRPGGYITLSAATIAKAYPDLNIKLIGAGIGGHKVPDCQRRLDKDVLQKKPTIVFIYIGINDVWHWTHPRVVARGKKGTTPEAFENGLRDMIKKINGVGARVILCTPTVIGEKSDGTNPDDQRLDEYSDISRIAYLKKHNPKNATEGILTSDSVHMNPAGNQLLAKLVLEALQVPASPASPAAPKAKKPANKKAAKTKRSNPARITAPAPTHADVAYDKHERTKLDFWQAKGEGPRPVKVFIHGGGWIQGDKSSFRGFEKFLDKGISVAAINYRLTETDPLPAPVHDAARAIQFLRSKAKEWNIDKSKFALTGGSAGGCTSVWLAAHDDLAKPDSEDPVERESTRVQVIAVRGAQTAIDPDLVESWIGPNVYHPMIYMAVGEKSIEDAKKNYAKHEALYKEFSAYYHLTKDDPPMYLGYSGDLTVPAKSIGHGIHHGMFGVKLQEKSKEVGHDKIYLESRSDDTIMKILLDAE